MLRTTSELRSKAERERQCESYPAHAALVHAHSQILKSVLSCTDD